MKPRDAKAQFEAFLATRAQRVAVLTPHEGVKSMLDFYRTIRAERCKIEDDGDMLLFQWGTYATSNGERFNYDITRQFIVEGGADEDIWQLGLTFVFTPAPELVSLGNGNRWCSSPDELSSFEQFIRSHPASAAVASRNEGQVKLTYDCAG
jgi:hypothetical protein